MDDADGLCNPRNILRRVFLAMILIAYCVSAYTVHLRFCMVNATKEYSLNERVLSGTAESPYQFQMYLVSPVLRTATEGIQTVIQAVSGRRLTPDSALAGTYWAFYTAGGLLFFAFLYLFCGSYATQTASAIACLFLAAVFPIFWFDNFFHPGDLYGCLLAVLIVKRLLRNKADGWYYALLFLSGLIWEKHVFIPICFGLVCWVKGQPKIRTLAQAAAGTAVAAFGQILPRLLYRAPRAWTGATLAYNLKTLPVYLIFVAILFGMQIAFMMRNRGDVQPLFRALALQFLIWPFIYLLMGGVLAEMRGIIIMVPLTWPVLAMAIDGAIRTNPYPGQY